MISKPKERNGKTTNPSDQDEDNQEQVRPSSHQDEIEDPILKMEQPDQEFRHLGTELTIPVFFSPELGFRPVTARIGAMLYLSSLMLVETGHTLQQEDDIQTRSKRQYHQPAAGFLAEQHLNFSGDGRLSNSEGESDSVPESGDGTFLARIDDTNHQLFVTGSAGPGKRANNPYKRHRQGKKKRIPRNEA